MPRESNKPFLRLHRIAKRFDGTVALRDVDLHVHADELLVVLGPTGAGKTTLLRAIAGLESPTSGTIEMAERDVTSDPPAARDVALVFQNFSLYPDRTVRQNMAFPLRAPGRGMTREAIDRRVNWAAELLKITHLLDRKSTRLSGGEMQRVAIGRAIVRRPRLFLLDEPLTNLDAKLRESLRVELVMLRRELKTPMIFVTHDQAEALSMGDRIVVLSEGAVLQEGAPEEIYRRPVSPIVARQLGQPGINLVRAMRNEGMWVSVSGLPLTRANGEPFDRALLGIRPEDIDVTGGTHEARIRIIEDMGPVHVLLVDWMGESFHLVSPKRPGLCPGDRIMPKVREGCAIVWNADENPTPDQCGGWNDS